jgi:hypothetical protein
MPLAAGGGDWSRYLANIYAAFHEDGSCSGTRLFQGSPLGSMTSTFYLGSDRAPYSFPIHEAPAHR